MTHQALSRRWLRLLPWCIVAVAIASQLAVIGVLLHATRSAEPPPLGSIEVDGRGSGHDVRVVRSPDERTAAVVLVVQPPWDSPEPATCRLVVSGHVVTGEAEPGQPAVCVWVGEAEVPVPAPEPLLVQA